jgi:RNA polymerase sigma factor (sigma-70 family)
MTRAGNDRAFEAIVDRYKGQLLRYCSRILPDGRGEDAVQQTFLKAYDAIHGDATPLSLRSWLFGIAHNVSLNILRQRGSDHEPLEKAQGAEEPAHATLERRERLREVLAAVAALPPGQRDALILRELEGRGHEEIARELGVSGGAARQLISRARNGIREAAAAILPMPLIMRLTDGTAAAPTAERVAELTAVGAGVTVTKVVATAAVSGTLLGGAVAGPELVEGDRDPRKADVAEAAPGVSSAANGTTEEGDRGGSAPDGSREDDRDRDDRDARDRDDDNSGPGSGGGGDDDGDRSGRRGGDDDDREDRSGPGGGDDDDRSGPGGGDGDTREDNSGPGSGGDDSPEDNSGPGSGDDGTAGDNSGPGSGGDDDPDPVDVMEPDDELDDSVDEDNSGPGSGEG